MLADKATVKNTVYGMTDMKSHGIYRRYWCDKTAAKDEHRYLTFRFFDAQEADRVWRTLHMRLRGMGYTNTVNRTSVESDYMSRTEGGEYVRVKVVV